MLVALVAAFFALDLGRFFSLDYIKARARRLRGAVRGAGRRWCSACFFAVYVAVTALSLPGAAIMTLLGGAHLRPVGRARCWCPSPPASAPRWRCWCRATCCATASRRKFGARLADIDRGIEREGAFYLFTLRLVPVFPFFVINLLMGLTTMKAATFYWVSQLGMLAGTLVYVNAGTQLAQISSLQGILSPGLIGSFVLLGLFPLMAKKIVDVDQGAQGLREVGRAQAEDASTATWWSSAPARPGLVTSYIAAAVKAKVTLVESHKMGGDCLNYGCVPSKALIRPPRWRARCATAPTTASPRPNASSTSRR